MPRPGLGSLGLLLGCLSQTIWAFEVSLNQKEDSQQTCSGMYSRKDWHGPVDPFILTDFIKPNTDQLNDPIVSVVIYEWSDEHLIGRPTTEGGDDIQYICNQDAVNSNLCTTEQLGAFILQPDALNQATFLLMTQAVHINDPQPINFPVTKTGYYCVSTFPYSGDDYSGVVEFRNAFGELQAAQIAKLPFYGALSIVYAVIGIFWGMLYFQNRHDVLAVQNYITAILIWLVIENATTAGYYGYQNRHGVNIGARVLMIIVAILNAFRNSFSFFLLLIVCMGYGVVKMSLGRTMLYVRYLAIAHFVFGVIYAVASLVITPDEAGPLVLLVVLPLSATLTAFYVWTLNSLNLTLKDLVERKQTIKAGMYRKLWYLILGSILVIFGFFFINSFAFAGASSPDFAPTHWKSRWFVLDGWLNLVYLADLSVIAFLWRPTANNRRFAMSEEIAQDDDGFEIGSLRDSLDDEEVGIITPGENDSPPQLHAASRTGGGGYGYGRDVSPLPAPKPQKPYDARRSQEAMEGEADTLFAVGDEDDESDDDEGGHHKL